jgi:hypothetical protein
MTAVRSIKKEVRDQRSEISGQKSEIRSQKSKAKRHAVIEPSGGFDSTLRLIDTSLSVNVIRE